MFEQRMLLRFVLPLVLVASACATPRLAPLTNRSDYLIEIVNPYPRDLNVTVNHVGGIWALGVVPAHRARLFKIRLLQEQPVSVVAANLWGFEELRQQVFMRTDCVARVILQNAPVVGPVTTVVEPRGPIVLESDGSSGAESCAS